MYENAFQCPNAFLIKFAVRVTPNCLSASVTLTHLLSARHRAGLDVMIPWRGAWCCTCTSLPFTATWDEASQGVIKTPPGCLLILQSADGILTSSFGRGYTGHGSVMASNYAVSCLHWSVERNACKGLECTSLYSPVRSIRLRGNWVLHRKMRLQKGRATAAGLSLP